MAPRAWLVPLAFALSVTGSLRRRAHHGTGRTTQHHRRSRHGRVSSRRLDIEHENGLPDGTPLAPPPPPLPPMAPRIPLGAPQQWHGLVCGAKQCPYPSGSCCAAPGGEQPSRCCPVDTQCSGDGQTCRQNNRHHSVSQSLTEDAPPAVPRFGPAPPQPLPIQVDLAPDALGRGDVGVPPAPPPHPRPLQTDTSRISKAQVKETTHTGPEQKQPKSSRFAEQPERSAPSKRNEDTTTQRIDGWDDPILTQDLTRPCCQHCDTCPGCEWCHRWSHKTTGEDDVVSL